MPKPPTADGVQSGAKLPEKRVFKRLVGAPCVIKSVLPDKGFGFAARKDVVGGKDIFFHLDRVVCDGKLPLERGDTVKCWVSEVEDDRPKATRVEVERFVVRRDRRIPMMEVMDKWRHSIQEHKGTMMVSVEDRRSARLHASTCIAMWHAAAEIVSHAMHPQWGALRAGGGEDPAAATALDNVTIEPADLSKGSRHDLHGVLQIARKIFDEGKEERSSLQFEKVQLKINDVRFTHDWISSEFGNGGSLEQMVSDLRRGRLLPAMDDRLCLSICKFRGNFYSINNRRVWVLKRYQTELQSMGRQDKVEVGVKVFRFCKGTAKFMRDMSNATQELDVGYRKSSRDVVAEAVLTDILEARLGVQDWNLEAKAETMLDFPVEDFFLTGDVLKKSRHLGRSEQSKTRPRSASSGVAMTSAHKALAGLQIVDLAKYDGIYYVQDQNLGEALKQLQADQPTECLRVKARILPLCPLTAKFILAHSTQVEGKSVLVRNSTADEGSWPVPRIVLLLLELATLLSATPKAPQVFRILSSCQLLGEQSALALAVQLGDRERVSPAFWPFVQQLAMSLPHRLGHALPSVRLLSESASEATAQEKIGDMFGLLTSACAALAADDGGLGGSQPWNMMPMVPCRQELRGMIILPTGRARRTLQALPVVHTRGRYEDACHYLDTYFRLLREDCNYSISSSLADIRDRGNKAEMAIRDGNAFRAQLLGCTVGKASDGSVDSKMKIVFKVQPMFPKQRWRFSASRFFMYGNLVACIIDEDFDRPVWVIVARRDLDKSTVGVDLYTGSKAGKSGQGYADALLQLEHAKSIVLVASPTYFRAYEPVLCAMQAKSGDDLPFHEELIQCKKPQFGSPAEAPRDMAANHGLVFKDGLQQGGDEFQIVGVSVATAGHSTLINGSAAQIDDKFTITKTSPSGKFVVKNSRGHQIAIVGADGSVRCLLAPGESEQEVAVEDEIIIKTGLTDAERYKICKMKGTMQGLLNKLDSAVSDPDLASITTLDQSQVQALAHVLRCRVSLVQGPPGTGKTFLGFKVLQLLISTSRILVLTYKNHALDEFLMQCIKGGYTKHIARVGGRSSDESRELESCNLKALKREFLSKEGWDQAVDADHTLAELRTHHMHARTAAGAAQAKVNLTMRQYSECHEHSADAFLASVSYSQLKTFLQKTTWREKKHAKEVSQLLEDSTWWLEDEIDQLPSVLMSTSQWLDEVVEGWGNQAYRWSSSLWWYVDYAISAWRPSKKAFDDVKIALVAQAMADESEDLDSAFAWKERDESIEVKTQVELQALVQHLSPAFQVLSDFQLRPGCLIQRGLVLLPGCGALQGQQLPRQPKDLLTIIRPPASLIFDEDDEAVRELQAEIEAERLASRGGEAMSQEEERGLIHVGASQKARRKQDSWVPTFESGLSDQMGDIISKRLLETPNLHALEPTDRAKLVHVQIARHKSATEVHLREALTQLEEACNEEEDMDRAIAVEVLRRKKIIGMTVTGASIYAELVRHVAPDVVMVEEAAEVLEPQIIAVLGPWVKHLVMIGDHFQLPPPVETYALKRNHHFDTSMMERLILNHLPHVSLLRQSRMLPSLSKLLHPIYPQLQDNLAVIEKKKAPECVRSEVFWWDCPHLESESERSKTNLAECERALSLVFFFISQGYRPQQITVLSSYQGQIAEIRRQIRNHLPIYLHEIGRKAVLPSIIVELDFALVNRGNRVDIKESDIKARANHKVRVRPVNASTRVTPGQYVIVEHPPGKRLMGDLPQPEGGRQAEVKTVQVKLEPVALQQEEMVETHTIDRYQGDENDIVIISLVRSNAEKKLGFLGTDDGRNRMCVAQSRARCGLYFLGNVTCLRTAPHWATLIELLEQRGCVAKSFPQRCPRHPDIVRDAREARDVSIGTAAVCGLMCEAQFECGAEGHLCKRGCHAGGGHEADNCTYPVTKTFACVEHPPHTFPGLPCNRRTENETCPFNELVMCPKSTFHKLDRKCGINLKAVFEKCHHPCATALDCGHACPRKCSEPCLAPGSCKAPRKFSCLRFPEQHPELYGMCNATNAEIQAACDEPCRMTLSCGHLCGKRCNETCDQQDCAQPCRRTLACGHRCPLTCKQVCRCTMPKFIACSKKTVHQVKGECWEADGAISCRCSAACAEALPCGHSCPLTCSTCNDMHDGSRTCNQNCTKSLPCGHPCPRKCSEQCSTVEDCVLCKPELDVAIEAVVDLLKRNDGSLNGGQLSTQLHKALSTAVFKAVGGGQKGWLKNLVNQSSLIEIKDGGLFVLASYPQAEAAAKAVPQPQVKAKAKAKAKPKEKATGQMAAEPAKGYSKGSEKGSSTGAPKGDGKGSGKAKAKAKAKMKAKSKPR